MAGSVSPSKTRARSTGPMHNVRRSRADVAHKPAARESLASDAQPSAAASSVASKRLSRVESMPSKLNADQKATNAAAARTSTVVASTRGRTSSAKRVTKPAVPSQTTATSGGTAAHPTTAKPMPTAPKPMAPRAVPKEPKAMKEVTANKPVTSHKVYFLYFSVFISLSPNIVGEGIMFLRRHIDPLVHPFIQRDIVSTVSHESLEQFMMKLRECSLAITDDLVRFWRSKVKVTTGCWGDDGIHVCAEASKSIFSCIYWFLGFFAISPTVHVFCICLIVALSPKLWLFSFISLFSYLIPYSFTYLLLQNRPILFPGQR